MYMTAGKTVALTILTFVSKVISLLFNVMSRFVIGGGNDNLLVFLPRESHGQRSLEVYMGTQLR